MTSPAGRVAAPKTVRVAGVPLAALSPVEAAHHLARLASQGTATHVHLVNAYTVSLLRDDDRLRPVITGSSETPGLNLADGKPLTWAARLSGQSLHQVRGPSLFEAVLEVGHEQGVRHFLLGSTEETLAALQRQITERFPRATIVGALSPPFRALTDTDRADQDETIRRSGAHLVWVGLGTPKQDLESRRLADDLGVVAVAVGAAFDFTAGTLRPAPGWVQTIGMEWFYRLCSEPRRLWKRYTLGNARFLRAVAAHRASPGRGSR